MGDKEKVLNWLSQMADMYKKQKELNYLYLKEEDEDYFTSYVFLDDEVHIKNAPAVCNLIGVEPKQEDWNTDIATAIYVSFVYEGVTFFSLEDYKEK